MPSPRLKRLAAWLRSSTRLKEDGGRAWPQVVDSPTATQTRHEVCSHGWRMGWWHGLDKQHQLWHSTTGKINVTNLSRNVSSTFVGHKEKILRNEKCPRTGGKKKDKMAQFMKSWSDVRKPPQTLADSLKTRPPQETTLGNQLQSWLHTTIRDTHYTLTANSTPMKTPRPKLPSVFHFLKLSVITNEDLWHAIFIRNIARIANAVQVTLWLSVNHLNRCLCSHCSHCLLVSTSVY